MNEQILLANRPPTKDDILPYVLFWIDTSREYWEVYLQTENGWERK